MPDALDERIERAAQRFQTLSIGKLRGDSGTFPSSTEGTVPAHNQTVTDIRDRNPRGKRGKFCLVFPPGLGATMHCGSLWQENCEGEYDDSKRADERSGEMNYRGLDHRSSSIK